MFGGIYSDIGDEQSVEQNLSTFSSHMGQIVRILAKADRNSLVLLDELGAGTDPAEGSALGVAIMEELHRRGARTVVTTHHGALKVFAANTQGVMNASVEFDPETLMPTYRLLVGRPGRSNALLVAERLGMPARVVESARNMKGVDEVELDTLIERLEKEAQSAREDRKKAAQEAEAAKAEKARFQELVRRAEDERRDAVRKAKEKASSIVSALRFKLRELEEMARKGPEKGVVRAKADEIKRLEEELKAEEGTAAPPMRAVEIESLSPGDTVKVYKYGKLGKVLAVKRGKGQVVVQVEALKVTLGPDELEPVDKSAKIGRPKAAAFTVTRADDEDSGPGVELNIIGLRAEEAQAKVDRYLDDCLLAGVRLGRIIHGRGTGALRKMVHETLKAHRGVKSFRHEEFQAGGDAVTLVEFG